MPGSLFPRSPSLIPDGHGDNDGGRHVHFAPRIHNPPPKRLQDPAPDTGENAPGPSRRPLRKTSSVQAAVERFNTGGDDADMSILLPSPHTSPSRAGKSSQVKGKRRTKETRPDDGEVKVRGKEQELVTAREEQQRHERQREKEGDTKAAEEAEREKTHDKERIRVLEEEIVWLKREVDDFLFISLALLNELYSY